MQVCYCVFSFNNFFFKCETFPLDICAHSNTKLKNLLYIFKNIPPTPAIQSYLESSIKDSKKVLTLEFPHDLYACFQLLYLFRRLRILSPALPWAKGVPSSQ